MDLLIILTYAGFCVAVFKIFRLPLNKWTVPTAVLGGIVLLGTLLLLMNYNHPYGKFAKEAFVSVPIVPAVKGLVTEVEVQPNKPIEAGQVLFRIDPKPFELKVEKKRAQLAEAEQLVIQNKAALDAAKATVDSAQAERDRTRKSYQRYTQANRKGGGKVFSKQAVENQQQLYLSAQANLNAAKAQLKRAELVYRSQIDGVDTRVAQLSAELKSAEYDLERTVVRAPSAGIVTQMALRPGSMAVPMPLRPAMVFIPEQRREIVGSFWQNSLLKMKPGFEAEVVIDAVPGHVFSGRVKTVLPAMSEGDLQASGSLASASRLSTHGRALAVIELDEDLGDYNLPRGVQGKMAIYSDSWGHVAVMRKILLRMLGWINYVFPMK